MLGCAVSLEDFDYKLTQGQLRCKIAEYVSNKTKKTILNGSVPETLNTFLKIFAK